MGIRYELSAGSWLPTVLELSLPPHSGKRIHRNQILDTPQSKKPITAGRIGERQFGSLLFLLSNF